ncbi:MAG: hypothetical protein V1855_02410 [bacterium]
MRLNKIILKIIVLAILSTGVLSITHSATLPPEIEQAQKINDLLGLQGIKPTPDATYTVINMELLKGITEADIQPLLEIKKTRELSQEEIEYYLKDIQQKKSQEPTQATTTKPQTTEQQTEVYDDQNIKILLAVM